MKGVIDKATGDLLKYGDAEFETESTFDPEIHEIRYDVPIPGLVKNSLFSDKYHRLVNDEWIELDNDLE